MYQPRYQAYLMHTNNLNGEPWEFIVWINQKWREFGHGLYITEDQHERFTQWLMDSVPEGQMTLF